jgi:hypothetical protein
MALEEHYMEQDVACPRCPEGPHHVELIAAVSHGTLLFGGPGGEVGMTGTVTLQCPTTGEQFEASVRVPLRANERLDRIRLAQSGEVRAESAVATTSAGESTNGNSISGPASGLASAEITDWRKGSATTGRDVASKLVVAGTAAVGAYFSVLKYIGGDGVTGWRLVASLLPVAGYLAVTVLSILVLRPMIRRIYGLDDFERFVDSVLHRQYRLLSSAASIFVVSTILAAAALVLVWP